jgi:hypothetical protein
LKNALDFAEFNKILNLIISKNIENMNKKVEISELKVGDSFREHDSKYSPKYTIRKIENGKIHADSSVTALSVVKFKKVFLCNQNI